MSKQAIELLDYVRQQVFCCNFESMRKRDRYMRRLAARLIAGNY